MSRRDGPLLPDVGVLAFVPDPWGNIWQVRHQVLTRLARYFQVIWVGPARGWREVLRTPGTHALHDTRATIPVGFTVYEHEFWLPLLFRPAWLGRFTARERLRRARKLLTDRGCESIVLYLWRPEFEPLLRSVPFDLSCYHIDDEYSWSEVDRPVTASEARLIAAVDQVFIHSPAMLEKKGSINPHTTFVPNGVDYRAFATAVPEPLDLASIPRPRIGYTGYLKKQLDLPLLSCLAARHPAWSFVFVGAQRPEIAPQLDELARRPNVHFLGAKRVDELAAYPQHFDVCIMPYAADGYTKFIYPLKLHEYLASGQPTVGTRIRSLEQFADVVALPTTADEWSAAIAEALRPEQTRPERRAARQAVAQQHDWDTLVARIARTMALRLGPREAQRFADLTHVSRESGAPEPPVLARCAGS